MTASSRQVLESTTIPAPAETLCLDFVNTLYWRGSDPQTETLADMAALAAWLAKEGGLPSGWVKPIAAWIKSHPAEAAAVFARAVALRETIHRLLVARAHGKALAAPDVAALNQALAAAPGREVLAQTPQGVGWNVRGGEIATATMLTPILWSATDLLLRADPARLRECANEKCRWVFLDSSRGGARRWCTMNSCGNRAKAHRHYHKAKAAKS